MNTGDVRSDDTAILIIVRHKLEALRDLVTWLELRGHERIVLVDNNSTFPPLLTCLDDTPHPT